MYQIIVSNSAEKDLDKLPVIALKKIEVAIDHLSNEPRPAGCKKLKGRNEDLWRIRVGDYRIIYSIADKIQIIDIRRVRHRKDFTNRISKLNLTYFHQVLNKKVRHCPVIPTLAAGAFAKAAINLKPARLLLPSPAKMSRS